MFCMCAIDELFPLFGLANAQERMAVWRLVWWWRKDGSNPLWHSTDMWLRYGLGITSSDFSTSIRLVTAVARGWIRFSFGKLLALFARRAMAGKACEAWHR